MKTYILIKKWGCYLCCFTLCLLLLASCLKQMEPQKLENNFAKKAGVYMIGIRIRLYLYELDNGKLNFSYSDQDDASIDLNLFKSFDKDEKWALYFDDDKNLWFYSHDTKQTSVWIKNDSLYTEHNFCSEDINIPHAFLEYLKMSKNEICDK